MKILVFHLLLFLGNSLITPTAFAVWSSFRNSDAIMSGRMLRHQPAISQIHSVVAQDGTGNFDSINAAVQAAPQNSRRRHVIHIKKGVYDEIIFIKNTTCNLTLLGDGIGVTIITGNRSVEDGGPYTMPETATVGVDGPGLMLQDMTIRNTAGAAKNQSIALRSRSQHSVVYRCSLEGYQDTLYAELDYQFYRDCQIYGTVDFVYGNAKAVFQNCLLFARIPRTGQQNVITAQGRELPLGDSGFVFQFCNITGDRSLKREAVETYLGRPWRNFSRVVFMESFMDDIIHPLGYLPWEGRTNDTEYKNTGNGSDVSGRVNWGGFKVVMDSKQAKQFTVRRFITGQGWLPGTGVEFRPGL